MRRTCITASQATITLSQVAADPACAPVHKGMIMTPFGKGLHLPHPASDLSLIFVYLHIRFQKESKEHKAMQKELDAANERFKEYERKDVKLREDIKHLSAKHRKMTEKLAKDTVKAEARPIPGPPIAFVLLLDQAAGDRTLCEWGCRAIVPL